MEVVSWHTRHPRGLSAAAAAASEIRPVHLLCAVVLRDTRTEDLSSPLSACQWRKVLTTSPGTGVALENRSPLE